MKKCWQWSEHAKRVLSFVYATLLILLEQWPGFGWIRSADGIIGFPEGTHRKGAPELTQTSWTLMPSFPDGWHQRPDAAIYTIRKTQRKWIGQLLRGYQRKNRLKESKAKTKTGHAGLDNGWQFWKAERGDPTTREVATSYIRNWIGGRALEEISTSVCEMDFSNRFKIIILTATCQPHLLS